MLLFPQNCVSIERMASPKFSNKILLTCFSCRAPPASSLLLLAAAAFSHLPHWHHHHNHLLVKHHHRDNENDTQAERENYHDEIIQTMMTALLLRMVLFHSNELDRGGVKKGGWVSMVFCHTLENMKFQPVFNQPSLLITFWQIQLL